MADNITIENVTKRINEIEERLSCDGLSESEIDELNSEYERLMDLETFMSFTAVFKSVCKDIEREEGGR